MLRTAKQVGLRIQRKENGAASLMEGGDVIPAEDWVVDYVDMMDRWREGTGSPWAPLSGFNDRRWGQNWPIVANEQQLALLRGPARVLLGTNNYAIGLMGGLTSYVIGKGFSYRITAKEDVDKDLAKKAQACWDEFADREEWSQWEQELFWRDHEDGESFLRHGFDDSTGKTWCRTAEPEQVWRRPDSDIREYSFGIKNPISPVDTQTALAYWFVYLDQPSQSNGEEVPVSQVVHRKCNVKRSIKRGITSFCYDTYTCLNQAAKLRKNLAEGAAVQAAIAFIRQYEMASAATVQAFVDASADTQRTDSVTGKLMDVKKYQPGTVLDIDKGFEYVEPPGATNAMAHVEVLRACGRGAAARFSAPAWLGTSDATDTVFASALTAESPFVKWVEREQQNIERHRRRTVVIVLINAIKAGELPPDALDRLDVQVEATSAEARNRLEEAQANSIRVQGGWKSKQTVMQEENLDVEQELQNMDEMNDRMGSPGMGLQQPGQEGDQPPQPGQDQPQVQESLLESTDPAGHNHNDLGQFSTGGSNSKNAAKESGKAAKASSAAKDYKTHMGARFAHVDAAREHAVAATLHNRTADRLEKTHLPGASAPNRAMAQKHTAQAEYHTTQAAHHDKASDSMLRRLAGLESTDPAGHEHKGKGEGGGQFTGDGGGGGGSGDKHPLDGLTPDEQLDKLAAYRGYKAPAAAEIAWQHQALQVKVPGDKGTFKKLQGIVAEYQKVHPLGHMPVWELGEKSGLTPMQFQSAMLQMEHGGHIKSAAYTGNMADLGKLGNSIKYLWPGGQDLRGYVTVKGVKTLESAWDEKQHPRADSGEFGSGGGSSKAGAPADNAPVKQGAGNGEANSDRELFGRIGDIDPHDLVKTEKTQGNLADVRKAFPKGEGYHPIVILHREDGKKPMILDGHNRAVLAARRKDKIPAVGLDKTEYSILKKRGFNQMQIAYGALITAGERDAADALNNGVGGFIAPQGERAADALAWIRDNRSKINKKRLTIAESDKLGGQFKAALPKVKELIATHHQPMLEADWDEKQHPRADSGEFGSGGGSSKAGAPKGATGNKTTSSRKEPAGDNRSMKTPAETEREKYAADQAALEKNFPGINEIRAVASAARGGTGRVPDELIKKYPRAFLYHHSIEQGTSPHVSDAEREAARAARDHLEKGGDNETAEKLLGFRK